MNFLPKSDSRFEWTHHALEKMRYYRITPGKVRSVLGRPKRVEAGVAPDTKAAMAPFGAKKIGEIWVMYQPKKKNKIDRGVKRVIISAWRYPGISKPGQPIPVPEDIRELLAYE